MSASAGRVLIIPKGDYNSLTEYHMLDLVSYQGLSFLCKKTSTGNTPSANSEYWQRMIDIDGMDISNAVETTITASVIDYPEIAQNDTLKVIFGKIKKFLADLKGNKFDSSNVTTIETSTTASQAYAAGKHLILEGRLYKVISPISAGGTIVTTGAGQNVESDKVEDMAVAISSVKNTYQSSPTAGTEVYDAAYINSLAGDESFRISTSNSSTADEVQTAWCSDVNRETIAGKSYYYKTLTLKNPIYGIPEVKLKPAASDGKPTAAEEELFDCLDYYEVDDSSPNSLKLYAETKPTTAFYIWIIRNGGRMS